MDPWKHKGWDQVPRRSKHPLSTGHIRHEPSSIIVNVGVIRCQSQCAKYGLTIGMKNVGRYMAL
jgi:hypothetical protein